MAENKPIPTPISEKEVDLLRKHFKGNEYLLKLVRGLFFGFELTAEEKTLIKKTFANEELREAIRKKVYPLLKANDVPIGQVADFWMGTETNILGQHRDTIFQTVESKQIVLEMLQKSFSLLLNPDGEKISLEYNPKLSVNDPLQVTLLARNLYIRTVETGLLYVKLAAEQETEITKEAMKNKKKDSSK